MRTNIQLDDELVERAQKLTGIKTKRKAVHKALRTLILLREQGEIRDLQGRGKQGTEGPTGKSIEVTKSSVSKNNETVEAKKGICLKDI